MLKKSSPFSMPLALFTLATFGSAFPIRAQAYPHNFPDSLPSEVLSETSPFAFSPNEFNADDFSFVWEGAPIEGVQFHVGRESLEWVRAGEVFLLPRGRLILEVEGEGDAFAQVRNLGFVQTLVREGRRLKGELPVALLGGGTGTRIEVIVNRGSKVEKGVLVVRFSPRAQPARSMQMDQRILADTGCSQSAVRADDDSRLGPDQWVYIGCRYIMGWGEEYSVAGLDTFVYWEGAVGKVRVDGVDTQPSLPGVWALRLRSAPGRVTLVDEAGNRVAFSYRIPDRQRYGSIGFGVGPYSYSYNDGASTTQSITPLLTLYGSLFFSEIFRIVAFNATSFNSNWFSDTGVYFQTDNFKVLDKRLQMKLLFGAETLSFAAAGGPKAVVGVPQGFEIIFRDFGGKGHNLTGGAFIYPLINGKKYYNTWVRWGSSQLFGEFNFIDWQEPVGSGFVSSTSFGVTVGAPLIRFF
jgi:hypothetical protein